ncbi:MAG: flagellar protein FlaG [Synergistaceae bacterium]|nr:flagellar protein FlaG [Synergistaceae bacterium]
MGMKTGDFPDLFKQSPGTEHHQAVRTKIIGDTVSVSHDSEYAKVAERVAEKAARQETQSRSDKKAEKARTENIDRLTEMRHLRYEVIQDADLVQISVINSEDGTVIRKVPPDKVVSFAQKVKEKRDRRRRRLDLMA